MSRTVSKHPALGAPYGKQQEDQFERARQQAQAQFESIREMVEALELCVEQGDDSDDSLDQRREEAQQRIQEDALSVEARSDWHAMGDSLVGCKAWAEYRILLCTGGPAVQITGTLSEHGEPETARLEMQDWFLPWTEYRPCYPSDHGETVCDPDAEQVLLAYARQFYFGE